VGIAYIYCSYQDQYNQTVDNLIASLLQQLLRQDTANPKEIISACKNFIQKQTRPTASEWSTLLKDEVGHFSDVFIIVDALDESSDSSGTRHGLIAEIQNLFPGIHLLVTSRHITNIESEFKRAARLEIHAKSEDIRIYLEDRLKKEKRLVRHVEADPKLGQTIVDSIISGCEGM
jgi:hypothetical protein